MLRCPRCRENGWTLVRFGVYLCPRCGETDPDGVPLAAAPAPPPPTERPSGAVFAAPPAAPLGAAPAPAGEASGGPPRILVGTIVVMVLLDVISAAGARNACSSITHLADIGFLLAVLSGKPWARTLGIFSAMLEVMFIVFAFALAARVPEPQLALFLRVMASISLPITVFWIYVLLRHDVTEYFARNAR